MSKIYAKTTENKKASQKCKCKIKQQHNGASEKKKKQLAHSQK